LLRFEYSGTGLMLPLKDLNAESLRVLVDRVLTTPAFRERALCMQQAIEKTRVLTWRLLLSKLHSEFPREK
jgi:UDP:flavonoid glycosyltransferase YjiC (YdhE family)